MECRQKMNPQPAPCMELLGLCMPLLEQCDSMLADWYCKQKKILSVAELTRMQTFVTR